MIRCSQLQRKRFIKDFIIYIKTGGFTLKKGHTKKLTATLILSLLLTVGLAGCGGSNAKETNNGTTGSDKGNVSETQQVTIKVSNWPKPNEEAKIKQYEQIMAQMSVNYPEITVEKDEWGYDVSSFLPKAASGQLPTLYETYFTETSKIINANYAADITDMMKEYGYDKAINPDLLKMVTKDGKYYGIPKDGYNIAMMYNINLFKEAGLVDENGAPKFPKTYEELATTAQTIKEKTGKPGMFLPTKSGQGGWMFMNIAWAYGAEFEKQVDGKWKAVFNSPEAVAALQYVKDLKWKYDVLPDNNLVDVTNDMFRMFGTDQVAMSFGNIDWLPMIQQQTKMSKDNVAMSALPIGPIGEPVTLLGGGLYMFSPSATPEQIDAGFKWLKTYGFTPESSEEALSGWDIEKKTLADQDLIVGPHGLRIWTDERRIAEEDKILGKYSNVNLDLFRDYMDNGSKGMRAEEPVNAQELYQKLDIALQTVLTDKNADPQKILDKVVEEFQRDYLDKVQ
jgi:multiple sugar transport system substrate-binding protein